MAVVGARAAVVALVVGLAIGLVGSATALGATAGHGAVAPPAAPSRACAAVALFAVPASGETDADADPDVAVGLLAGLTTPAARRWGSALHVEYLSYPASIDRPLPYFLSEARGVDALTTAMTTYARRCPAARLLPIGFSQGADIVDDLLHRASRGTVALPPERIAGAVLLGNPRRNPAAADLVRAPGRGILGPRPARELDVYDGRVYEVCAARDPICATDTLDLRALREGLASGAHRSYPTLDVDGTPLYTLLGAALDDLVRAAAAPSAEGPARPAPSPATPAASTDGAARPATEPG